MQKEKQNVVLNKNCHSRKSVSGIFDACRCASEQQTKCVEDPRLQASGMTIYLNNTPSSVLTGHLPPHGEAANLNAPSTWRERAECVSTGVRGKIARGFTLIELLVVVLIIGILAAVALPQYQLAVEKTRAQEALVNLRALAQAERLHELETGNKTTIFDKLNIQIVGKAEGNTMITSYFTYTIKGETEIVATRNHNGNNLYNYQIYVNTGGHLSCKALTEQTREICEHISGTSSYSYHHEAYYYTFPKVKF